MEIKKISMCETWEAANWSEILAEYVSEASIEGLPNPTPNIELYRRYEALGVLDAFGAFIGDTLIGYITLLEIPGTHYDIATLFSTESFFVLKAHRHTGAGLRLLKKVEEVARSRNAGGLLVSARSHTNLATVLAHKDYKETNRVFFKKFANE